MSKDDPGYITALAADTSYGGYLQLAALLSAQRPRSARTCAMAALSSWIMSFIQSSEVWCWMMNSISSWCDERGRCAASKAESCR